MPSKPLPLGKFRDTTVQAVVILLSWNAGQLDMVQVFCCRQSCSFSKFITEQKNRKSSHWLAYRCISLRQELVVLLFLKTSAKAFLILTNIAAVLCCAIFTACGLHFNLSLYWSCLFEREKGNNKNVLERDRYGDKEKIKRLFRNHIFSLKWKSHNNLLDIRF